MMTSNAIKNFFTRKKIIIISILLVVCIGLVFAMNSLFYHGDSTALTSLQSTSTITVVEKSDYYAFVPKEHMWESAFILYPGALVDAESYAPLMVELAEKGYTSFIARMPFNMAILKGNAADRIIADYPQMTNWYIGGHSLGGVMASNYADKHPDLIKGIAFLASYPNKDLADQVIKVVSLYGTNDQVLNMSAYKEATKLLPTDSDSYTEIPITGGNHASFGNYGPQSGDGELTISPQEQQAITLEALTTLMQD